MKFRYDAHLQLGKAIRGRLPGSCAILHVVKQWTTCPEVEVAVPPPDEYSDSSLIPSIARALESQRRIGWACFFRGIVSQD